MYNKIKLLFEGGEPVLCPKCKSGNISKGGHRYNKHSIKQGYRCKNCCKSHFTFDDGFLGMQTPKKIILFGLQNSKKYSCREIGRIIK